MKETMKRIQKNRNYVSGNYKFNINRKKCP